MLNETFSRFSNTMSNRGQTPSPTLLIFHANVVLIGTQSFCGGRDFLDLYPKFPPLLLKGNEADKSLLMLDLAPSTIPNLQLFFAMHFKPDLCLSLGPIQEEINPTHLLHLHLKGHFLLDTNKTEDVNAVKVEIPFYHKLWFLGV